MKIPFLQHIGIGIHISDKAIRWVELSRMGDTLKIQSVDTEEVKNGDIEGCLSALVERRNPSYLYVTVNVDSRHLKQQVIDVPDFNDPEYFDHWLDEQVEKLLPGELERNQFIWQYHLLGSEGDQKCLFTITKKQAIENRRELLASVGLKPIIITTGHLQAGYGFVFNEEFVSGPARLVSIFEDTALLHYYNGGMLERYIHFSHSADSASDMLEEATTYLATDGMDLDDIQNLNIYLVESDFNKTKAIPSAAELSIDNIRLSKPLSEISPKEKNLKTDHSIAAGMAIKQLYPALDTVNFLDEERQESVRNEVQKKDALHTGILMGGLVVLTFLSLVIAQFILNSWLEETGHQVDLLQDDINTVNVATEKVRELKEQANQAEQLVTERTSMARTLDLLGRSLPDQTWFNEVQINKSENNKEAAIYGYAHNDALIASLMGHLEDESATENVRLIFSEAVSSTDIYAESSFEEVPLVRFEIRISINPEKG